MRNRTFDPYLAAMRRIIIPVMHVRVHFIAGNPKCTIPYATMCTRSSWEMKLAMHVALQIVYLRSG
jgi:hypothetical protein